MDRKTIIAFDNSKDAAIYCSKVIPLSLHKKFKEEINIRTILADLLPDYISSDNNFISLLTSTIESRIEHAESIFHFLITEDDKEANERKKYQESVGKKKRFIYDKMISSLSCYTTKNLDAYAFFGFFDSSKENDSVQNCLVTTLSGMELIDTKEITWQEILAVRNDPDAVSKLRRLRLLFETDYAGKSQAYIEDDILRRIDDYNLLVKQYQFETKALVLEQLLSSKSMLALAASSAVASYIGAPVVASASLLVGASIEVGKACLTVTKRRHKYTQDLQTIPIGYIVDIFKNKLIQYE